MRDARGPWLALLGLLLGAPAPAAGPETDEELLAFLEFLGDPETGGDDWSGYFDSLPERLPERPDGTVPPAPAPVAAEEVKP